MIIGVLYFIIGIGFGTLAWDRHASDSQNFAALSMAALIWPLILLVGLIAAGVQLGKK